METKVVELNLTDVLPNRFQPRIRFSEESIQELATSIKDHGVIQPIVVRKIGDKFEIVAGERRHKASIMVGKTTIPAIITDLNEKDSAEVALIENVQRKDLTPIEEAISYKKILDMGFLTQDILASKLGKTQSTIANKIRLLNLDDDVQEALLNEQISERHARSLLRLSSKDKQKIMLTRIINERLTVRKTDEEIDKMINNNENIEFLNFENTEAVNNTENLEIFNPTIETLNIPTTPIMNDTMPEILQINNTFQPESNVVTEVFNPNPEAISTSVPPISEEQFEQKFSPSVSTEEISEIFNPIQPQVENLTQENINSINPGFMDINKIETEAKKINEEKPLAPVNDLMETSVQNVISPIIESDDSDNEGAENILVPGKFFNLMTDEVEDTPMVEPTQNNFDFNFDINSLNNVEATSNFPTRSTGTVMGMKPETESPTIETINNPPLFNPLNNENQKYENPVPLESNISSSDTIAELELPGVKKFDNIPDFENISFEEENNETIINKISTNSPNDLKTAINMIRDFADQLEQMGYVIDTDEFDFEDMYQVIFKINK